MKKAEAHKITIETLNETIVRLRSENLKMREAIKEFERIPVPKTVISQIAELTKRIRELEADMEFYKPYIPIDVVINRLNKDKPKRKGGFRK